MTKTTGSPTLQTLVAPHLPEVCAHPPTLLEATLSLCVGRPTLSGQDAAELAAVYMRLKELEAAAALLVQALDPLDSTYPRSDAVQWDDLEEAHGLAVRLMA